MNEANAITGGPNSLHCNEGEKEKKKISNRVNEKFKDHLEKLKCQVGNGLKITSLSEVVFIVI